jgi:hypothetical protein
MKYQITLGKLRKADRFNDRIEVGNVPRRLNNSVCVRLGYDEKTVTFWGTSDDPNWKPSKYSTRPSQVGFAVDIETDPAAPDETVVEVDWNDFQVERQAPSRIDWEGLTPRAILEAFVDPEDLGLEEIPADIEKSLKNLEEEGSGGWGTFATLNGVDIEFEFSTSANRGKTRFGKPATMKIKKVTLKGGGWDRNSQLQRRMEPPTPERLTELVHKYEEIRDFVFERDHRREKAERERKERARAVKARREAFSKELGPAKDLTSSIATESIHTVAEWPKAISINLSKLTPEQAARAVKEFDAVLDWIESEPVAEEKNEKVSE